MAQIRIQRPVDPSGDGRSPKALGVLFDTDGHTPGSPTPESAAPPTGQTFPDVHLDPRPLPETYGETQLVLMTRDSEWLFAYWEISDDDRRRFDIAHENHGKKLALRVFDLGDVSAQVEDVLYDVPITECASSWYLHVARPRRLWRVDLGVVAPDGSFQTIARSNSASTPGNKISDAEGERWIAVDVERFEKVMRLSGAEALREGEPGASEILETEHIHRLAPRIIGPSEQLGGSERLGASEKSGQ